MLGLMKHVMPIADRPNLVMQRGLGSFLWDQNGSQYLDFVQGWAVNCLGHCPPEIQAALQSQCQRLINPSPAFYNDQMMAVSDTLARLSGLDHVFFANSGAEANEGAIKLARKWGAKHKAGAHSFVVFENGFHGRTLATMSASGKTGWDQLFEPKVPGFTKVPYGDIEAVRAHLTPQTVGIMLELVQGEGGVVPADPAFVTALRELATQHHTLLMVDEVQTGIARTGDLFAYQHHGIVPDILTLGKGLGGGVPVAALLATQAASVFEFGDQGGTYNGNPLMLAVVAAVLEAVTAPGFLAHVHAQSARLQSLIMAHADRWGVRMVRGRGLLLAMVLTHDRAPELVSLALKQGLLVNAPRPNVIRLMPSLRVSDDELALFVTLFDQTVKGLT